MPSPDLGAISTARTELTTTDVTLRELDLRTVDLATRRAELLGLGEVGAPLRAVETELRRVANRRTAAEEARSEIVGRIGELSDGIVTALGKPDAAVATLDGPTPIVLLPVRIETRFSPDGGTLRIRVYPDQIHLDVHDPALTNQEIIAGKNYWTIRWPNLDDTANANEAWAKMCAGFRPGRARYVVDRMRPTAAPADGGMRFPDVEQRGQGWSRPATATALPDRIVVAGYRRQGEGRYSELFRVWGGSIPDRLQVAPAPNVPKPDAEGDLPVDQGLRWLHEPDQARQNGLLITVTDQDLAPGRHLSEGIDRLIVTGVDWTLAPADAAHALESLLAGQRDEGQLAFVPQGTPTNNTSSSSSGWTSERAASIDAYDPAAAAPTFDTWSAGHRLAGALGLDRAIFDRAPGSASRESRVQAALSDALWRVTGGYYLVDLLDPLAKDPAIDADLREHVAAHLFAGGPLPTVRVGPQPYGILPVVARARYRAAKASRAESGIHRVATVLREVVEPFVEQVPHLRRAGDAQAVDETMLALLLRTPVPWSFDFRQVIPPTHRKNISVYWDLIAAFQQDLTAIIWSRLQTYTLTRLSELTLDPKTHSLNVPLVRKGDPAAGGNPTAYLQEIKALLVDDRGELALRVRENSEALLEALIASAGARELTRVHSRKVTDFVERFQPELGPNLEIALRRDISTPDSFRIEAPIEAAPFEFASSRDLAEAVIPAIEPTASIGAVVARDIATFAPDLAAFRGAPTDPLYWLGRFAAALDDLAAATPSELEWAFRGHLDLFSSRLDAWWTSLAASRLESHRAKRPTGVHIGCWGWVEDLRPDPAGTDSLGYVHTPSLDHAATAALLRSGRQAHQDAAGELFDVEITAARVRESLALLRGVTNGQRIAALLGYRLERRLQEAGPELAQYIWPLRKLAPMRSDEAELAEPTEVLAARDVVDALTLLDRWKNNRTGVLDGAGVAAAHRTGVTGVLDAVAGLYDGVGDMLIAEAVHQAAQGNLERSGAALAAQDRQAAPPELDFIRTPRPGHAVTQRVGLLLQEAAPAAGWPADARSEAEPRLDAWAGLVVGPPASFVFTGRLVRGKTASDLSPISLQDLGLGALSVVLASARPADGGPSELEARIALAFAGQVADAAPADRIEVLADGGSALPERGLGLLATVAGAVAKVVGSPAMGGSDLTGSAEMRRPSAGAAEIAVPDVAELEARVVAAVAALGGIVEAPGIGVADAVGSEAGDAIRAALGRASLYDANAVTLAPVKEDGAALLVRATQVRDHLAGTLASARARLAELPAGGAQRVNALTEIVKSVFGSSMPVLPTLIVADPAPISASLGDQAALTAGDANAPVAWLHRLALVRPALDPLALAMQHAEADDPSVADAFRIVQFPHAPGATWCALPFGTGGPPPNGTAALAAHSPASLDVTQPFAGVVVDSWTETVPGAIETTAVTFHYDAPGARAPQSMILAVHPEINPKAWDLPTLLDTVHEAADLARLRTLTAAELAPLGGFLPALYLPDNYTRDVPSVPLRDLLVRVSALSADSPLANVLGKE